MKLNLSRCSIVVIGTWNQAIFVPQWVKDNLFPGSPDLEVEFGFSPQLITQYSTKLVQFAVAESQIQVLLRSGSEEAMRELERSVVEVLVRLPQTPVRGIGINVGFDLMESPDSISNVFNVSDSHVLGAFAPIVATSIRRTLAMGDKILNISLTRTVLPAPVYVDLNHHWEVTTADKARAAVSGAVIPAFDLSRKLASDVYGIQQEKDI